MVLVFPCTGRIFSVRDAGASMGKLLGASSFGSLLGCNPTIVITWNLPPSPTVQKSCGMLDPKP